MDNFTVSWKMKDLLPNYDVFLELANEYLPDIADIDIACSNILYNLLWNNFCNCSVAFDTKEDFYRKFYSILWNEADYYLQKLEKIKEIRKMSNAELIKEYTNISNVAANNNKVVNSPLTEIIPYITSQATSTSSSNLLSAIGRAISEYRNNELEYFLDKFNKLFLDLHSDSVIYY